MIYGEWHAIHTTESPSWGFKAIIEVLHPTHCPLRFDTEEGVEYRCSYARELRKHGWETTFPGEEYEYGWYLVRTVTDLDASADNGLTRTVEISKLCGYGTEHQK